MIRDEAQALLSETVAAARHAIAKRDAVMLTACCLAIQQARLLADELCGRDVVYVPEGQSTEITDPVFWASRDSRAREKRKAKQPSERANGERAREAGVSKQPEPTFDD